MGEIALNFRKRFETSKNTPKMSCFVAQNGGIMGFLVSNWVVNAPQMGEIALKMTVNRFESVPNGVQK